VYQYTTPKYTHHMSWRSKKYVKSQLLVFLYSAETKDSSAPPKVVSIKNVSAVKCFSLVARLGSSQ